MRLTLSLRIHVCGSSMDEEARGRQQRVAAQRRKWGVRYFTQSGKPDKRRAPGRPWDPTVYAGPERDTFCAGQPRRSFKLSREKGHRVVSMSL